jgi:hypothetical protein
MRAAFPGRVPVHFFGRSCAWDDTGCARLAAVQTRWIVHSSVTRRHERRVQALITHTRQRVIAPAMENSSDLDVPVVPVVDDVVLDAE